MRGHASKCSRLSTPVDWFALQLPICLLVPGSCRPPLTTSMSHSPGSGFILVNTHPLTQAAAASFCLGCTPRGAEPGPWLLSGIPGKVSPQWSCTWPSLCVLCPFSSVCPKYNLILRRFLVGCFHTVGGRESIPNWGAS